MLSSRSLSYGQQGRHQCAYHSSYCSSYQCAYHYSYCSSYQYADYSSYQCTYQCTNYSSYQYADYSSHHGSYQRPYSYSRTLAHVCHKRIL